VYPVGVSFTVKSIPPTNLPLSEANPVFEDFTLICTLCKGNGLQKATELVATKTLAEFLVNY